MAIFRKFEDSDATHIVEAIREAYSEEYSPKYMYDEGYLCEANHTGNMQLTIATTEDGQFVGVVGLKKTERFRGVVEGISLIVREQFREKHIASNLLAACLRGADVDNICSTYGSAALLNIYSQRIMSKLGFQATGLWLNRKFLSDKLRAGRDYTNDKVNMIVLVRNNSITDAGKVYIPERYHKFANSCYARFDVKVELCDTYSPIAADLTEFELSMVNDYDNINYFVYGVGKDFVDFVIKVSVLENKLSSVSVLIDCHDQSSACAIRILEQFGYKFTGLLPLASTYEYAIFHLCDCNVDYDELAIYESYNYIKEELSEI